MAIFTPYFAINQAENRTHPSSIRGSQEVSQSKCPKYLNHFAQVAENSTSIEDPNT